MSEPESESPKFLKYRMILSGLLVVWIASQIYFLPEKHLWNDEFGSILAATGRYGEMLADLKSKPLIETTAGSVMNYLNPDPGISTASFFRILASNDIHPPLFFLFLRFWIKAGASSTFALVLLPLSISLIGIIVFYLLSKDLIKPPYHFLPVVLWMISIQGWSNASEIRHYGLVFLCTVLLLKIVVVVYQNPERLGSRYYILALGTTMALGLLTHYMFFWLLIAVNLWVLTNSRIRGREILPKWIKADMFGFLITAPWIPLAFIQFNLQQGVKYETVGLLEAGYKLLETFVHFVIWPQSLLAFPVILMAILLIAGLVRPPFPGFRTLFIMIILACLLLPASLGMTDLVHLHLFKIRYLLPAVPVVLLTIGQGAAALPTWWLKTGSVLLLVLSVGANTMSFVRYEKLKNNSKNLNAVSSFVALGGALEHNVPPDLVVAVDTRRPIEVLRVASNLSEKRTILVGDYSTLPSALSDWARENEPGMIFFAHKKLSLWDPNAVDSTEDIASALSDLDYQTASSNDFGPWRGTFLIKRGPATDRKINRSEETGQVK